MILNLLFFRDYVHIFELCSSQKYCFDFEFARISNYKNSPIQNLFEKMFGFEKIRII
jgi:hypothetical protein